ncbi:MAG: hypothetical protein MJ157_04490, partial [Clostridia bacterium]|nr:hypothetical protein [Clostridia bacterium]
TKSIMKHANAHNYDVFSFCVYGLYCVDYLFAEGEKSSVYLPDFSRFAWVGDLVEELAVFPQGSHDDQVDALTQANIYYNEGLKFDFANLIS